ncbi:hypothetical protein CWD88_23175 [Burkholderia pseudomallei]|uniref:Uncharacterized protein n=1 Tax=Burkholderia pseudomallei TaxID=28450 RepID=A0AAX0U660_BURPE|nr:hypothetical protein BHT10_31030 [Burkholderia pseudomallei]PJO63950.1 hypothetical protein CWD88_23175 [Burkholderia pseudomallei]PNW92067.1 hypothetical protein CF640_23255 [Burkholderia pseudomallei]PNX18801.1 hypothetical protein CF645_28510 [Burkholderia pseudomallei]PPF03784.1 hypothetical protein B9D88_029405 [Burkholderia pseudomallei]
MSAIRWAESTRRSGVRVRYARSICAPDVPDAPVRPACGADSPAGSAAVSPIDSLTVSPAGSFVISPVDSPSRHTNRTHEAELAARGSRPRDER